MARRRSSPTTRRPPSRRSPHSSARSRARRSSRSSARRARRRRRTSSVRCARPTSPTIWAERSLNNEIGLPLTVCRLEPETEVLVTEMGMRGLGQVAALCAIARPGRRRRPARRARAPRASRHGRARRGGERGSDRSAPGRRRGGRPARRAPLDPYLDARRRHGAAFRSRRDRGSATGHALHGRRRRSSSSSSRSRSAISPLNTLAALHAYDALGFRSTVPPRVSPASQLSPWRGEETRAAAAAGSSSTTRTTRTRTRCAPRSQHLAERAGDRRKVAILGEMAELGETSGDYHRAIGELAAELGVAVIGVGEASRAYEPVAWAADPAAAVDEAPTLRAPGRRRPRQGLPRGGARRHRRRDHELRSNMVPVLDSGPDRDGGRRRDRAEVHRPPSHAEPRPADSGRGPRDARREAGDADHGRPSDPRFDGRPVPLPLAVHGRGDNRPLHDPRLRC